jgi:hypothetical protein
MGSKQPVIHEPSIAVGELSAVLLRLDEGDVNGARELLEGWQTVEAGELPAYVGQGLPAYVDLLDRTIGLVGGFLRYLGTRDDRAVRVEKMHREFERFAKRFSDAYAAELDENESIAEQDADETAEEQLDTERHRKAVQLAAAELAPLRARAFRRHLAALTEAEGSS